MKNLIGIKLNERIIKKNNIIKAEYLFHMLVIFSLIFIFIFVSSISAKAAKVAEDTVEADGRRVIRIVDSNNEDKKTDDEVIQDALASNDNKPLKVILEVGTYNIHTLLKVFDNTTIVATDAEIIQHTKGKGLLINARIKGSKYGDPKGGYNSCKNIKVVGGDWIGTAEPLTSKPLKENGTFEGYSNVMFLHGENITLKDMNIYNNYNGHLVEFGGIKNGRIENCDLNYGDGDYFGEFDNEAIQIDNTYGKDNSPAGYPYDDTPCKNIVIKNCKINFARGIGTNRFGHKNYDNIKIVGNTIETTQSEAVDIYDTKKLLLEKNNIKVLHKHYMHSTAVVIGINHDNKKKIKPNITIKKNKINGSAAGIRFIDFSNKGYNKVIIKENKIRARANKKNCISKGSCKFKKFDEKKNKKTR